MGERDDMTRGVSTPRFVGQAEKCHVRSSGKVRGPRSGQGWRRRRRRRGANEALGGGETEGGKAAAERASWCIAKRVVSAGIANRYPLRAAELAGGILGFATRAHGRPPPVRHPCWSHIAPMRVLSRDAPCCEEGDDEVCEATLSSRGRLKAWRSDSSSILPLCCLVWRASSPAYI